jgi:hypothetical protein
MFLRILTVASLATFEIYAAIPAGFAFGLSPWIIFFASVTGGLVGVFVAAFLGNRSGPSFTKTGPVKMLLKRNIPGFSALGINMALLVWDF